MTTEHLNTLTDSSHKTGIRKKIFLVDDHDVVRQGIGFLINGQVDMTVCGEAGEGPETIRAVQENVPDVIVLDITLAKGSGLELIKDLRAIVPQVAILVLTAHDERVYGERALRAGASGYINKAVAIDQILVALRVVLEGRLYVSPRMADRILSQRIGKAKNQATDPVDRLSDRELEIYKLIGSWKSTREIAGSLSLSTKTVEYYREQLKKKLGLPSGVDLGRSATTWMAEKERSR